MRYNESSRLHKDPNLWLKRGIWFYLLLLIFEGALRKWVLPGLAAPLLIVRDPLAVLLLWMAWNKNLIPSSVLLKIMVIIGAVAILTALIFGHGNLAVALFGARIFLLHFPLVFVIGRVLDKADVIQIGKFLLWVSIPMALLVALQFYSPQSALVNRGVGGDSSGAGFSGAMGYLRPPGTFSFTNGISLFYGLTASFMLYFWLHPQGVNKIALCGGTLSLIAVIPLSISRTLVFTIAIIVFFALVTVLRKPENFLKVVLAGIGIFLMLSILSNFGFFQTATKVLTLRFTNASTTEGGLKGTFGNRYFGWMATAIATSLDQPFFGHGIGLGTNVGSALLTGDRKFLVSEEEWNRQIGELGALMGIGVIVVRLALSFKMSIHAIKKLQNGQMLPWMLLSFGLTVIPQGQWAQPTALGFSVLAGGLIIAAMNHHTETDHL
ncbi:hypothetical protein DBR11_04240 [Pedobacter sp. HMWF019]|uniref:hypothetical protein n=1 Tax=Pedobacter sp. HMWF019 TaxID=2056856 RepID=UPI000D341C8C|nr:hypothetical protein [Pedobacter sp. HMWF019]PTT02664.1 hypothetical protein DBR11_04240 [Pedobacter sp. HMWF019]